MRRAPPQDVLGQETQGSTKRLLSELKEGLRIEKITFRFWNWKGQTYTKIIVSMSKNEEPTTEIVSINESDFVEHITHYKKLPIPGTSAARFVYLDNPNEYEDFSFQFWNFISGESKLTVAVRQTGIRPCLMAIVLRKIMDWVSREGQTRVSGHRVPRLFVDSCLITITENEAETTTVPRESLDLDSVEALRNSGTDQSRILILSPLWFSPKYPKYDFQKFTLQVDPLFGFILADVKKRDFICFAIRSLRQCLAAYGKPPGNDVSVFITEMVRECLRDGQGITILAPPTLNSNYTAVAWTTFGCVNESFQRTLCALTNGCLTIPEFLAFGYPGLPGEFNSFDFKRQAPSAAINLRFWYSGRELTYNLRFDCSSEEPKLHADFQIWAPSHPLHRKKMLKHVAVNIHDLWRSSRDLYLGLLAAGSYDPYFDRLIERKLQGFERAFSENPSAIYPLLLRVYIKPKEDWLHANDEALRVLIKIAGEGLSSLTPGEKKLIPELVKQKLFKEGFLTLQGQMLATRLRLTA